MKYILLAATVVLVALLGIFTTWKLGSLPGVMGDEAYFGVLAKECLANDESIFRVHQTGNPIWPGQVIPLVLLEKFFPSNNFVNLRIPTLGCYFLMVILCFPLMKRHLGNKNAFLFSLLAWALPVHLCLARMGWESSQTPLFSLLSVYFAMNRQVLVCLFFYLMMIYIHPSNAFFFPILMGIYFGRSFDLKKINVKKFKKQCLYLFLFLFTALIGFYYSSTSFRERANEELSFENLISRVSSPLDFFDMFLGLGNLLSGASMYYFVSTTPYELSLVLSCIFYGIVIPLFLWGTYIFYKHKNGIGLGLIGGIFFSLFSLYMTSGTMPFRYENVIRYPVFYTIPSCLLFVSLLGKPLEVLLAKIRWSGVKKETFPFTLKVSVIFFMVFVYCVSFIKFYLIRINNQENYTNYVMQYAFLTGSEEPKLAAYQALKKRFHNTKIIIAGEDWTTYKPLSYLAMNDPNIEIVEMSNSFLKDSFENKDSIPRLVIGYQGSVFEEYLKKVKFNLPKHTIYGNNNLPILHIWKLSKVEL